MKKITTRIILTSILTGALLFLSPSIQAASLELQQDSVPKARTHTSLPGVGGPRTFSRIKRMAMMDSLRHDSTYFLRTDSLRCERSDSLGFRISDLGSASASDSLAADSLAFADVATEKDTAMLYAADTLAASVFPQKHFTPSPQRATILSAVFPGLGQAYNRRYWKIPIIYASGAALYYGYHLRNEQFLEAKRLYNEGIAAGLTINDQDMKKHESDRDFARSKRDYFVIYMGMLYVANVVDAMTDAYFRSYDMSDELNISIKPALTPAEYSARMDVSYGLKLKVTF